MAVSWSFPEPFGALHAAEWTALFVAVLASGWAISHLITGRRRLPWVALVAALVLPVAAAFSAGSPPIVEGAVHTWDSNGAGLWRLDTLVDWLHAQALRCGLAALPGSVLILGTRVAADRVRPKPPRRGGWLHGFVVVLALGVGAFFTWGIASAVPVAVAAGVGVLGWAMADTVRLGRAWRNGRALAAVSALGWATVVMCAAAALTAWRIAEWLDALGRFADPPLWIWEVLLSYAPGLSVGALGLVLPVLALAVRLLLRARAAPLAVAAAGMLYAGGFAQAVGLGWQSPPETLDLLLAPTPYADGCAELGDP